MAVGRHDVDKRPWAQVLASLWVCAVLAAACGSSPPTDSDTAGADTEVAEEAAPDSSALASTPKGGATAGSDSVEPEPPAEIVAAASVDPAELIVTGGVILTMDPEIGKVRAMAITGGRIVAVGGTAEINALIGPDTTLIDLRGRAVLPGFVDAHTHALSDIEGWTPLDGQLAVLEAGITTLADASVEPALLERYLEFADDFVIDVGLYLNRVDFCGADAGTWYEAYPPDTRFSDHLRLAGVKIFTDGGACNLVASSEPFIDGVGIAQPYFSPDVLTDYVRTASEAGYQVLIHAQGDLAITDAQDALAAVLDGGANVLHHRIDHNVILTPDMARRYSEIGIVPVVFGFNPTCSDISWTDFWKGRGENWRQLWEANPDLPIAWHGDDPGAPPLDPLLDLASYVTRAEIAEDGSVCEPEPWLADTTITVEQALTMMTRNSAYALRFEDEVGTLTPGKQANFVIISDDPTAMEPMALFDLEVVATYVRGRAAYCANEAEETVCALKLDVPTGTPTPPPPEPIDGVTASASRDAHGPEVAFDGIDVGESFWSSGADAPQWIQVNFEETRSVERIRFVVFQNPPSDTVHELAFLIDGAWEQAITIVGFTTTGEVLEWASPSGEPIPIDGFRMTTLASLSWPEWSEIEIEPTAD